MVHVPEDLAVTVGYKTENLSVTDKLHHPNQYINIPQYRVMSAVFHCCIIIILLTSVIFTRHKTTCNKIQ